MGIFSSQGTSSANRNNATAGAKAGGNGNGAAPQQGHTPDQAACIARFEECFGAWAGGKFNKKDAENDKAYATIFLKPEHVQALKKAAAAEGKNPESPEVVKQTEIYNDCSWLEQAVRTQNDGKALESKTRCEQMFKHTVGKEAGQDFWVWWAQTFEQSNMVPVWQAGAPGSFKVFFHMQSDILCKATGKTAAQVPLVFECQLRQVGGSATQPEVRIQGFRGFSAGEGINQMVDILSPMKADAGAPAAALEDNQKLCHEHFLKTFTMWGEGKFNGTDGKKDKVAYETYESTWSTKGDTVNDMTGFGHALTKLKASNAIARVPKQLLAEMEGVWGQGPITGQDRIMDYWVWWNQTFEQDPAAMIPTINVGAVGSNKVLFHFVSDMKCKATGVKSKPVGVIFECSMRFENGKPKIHKFQAFPSSEAVDEVARIIQSPVRSA